VPPLRLFNAGLRALCAGLHHFQYKVEGFLRPSAEWFDHEVDVHWQWVAKQRSMFLERGVLNTLAMRPGAEVLELCCGDGFNAHRFYAGRGSRVLAVDYNTSALRHARRYHARANVEYRQCDLRSEFPEGTFDNIVWDSAIHHFTPPEASAILASAKARLRPAGVLSGYTVIEPHAEYAFTRMRFSAPEELAELLGGVFTHVAVHETPDALRRNLYFFASETPTALPFAPDVNHSP
jgi:SAM-dependent methyltransferase